MPLFDLPALFMRGGTSKGIVFNRADLPASQDDWAAIFLAAMGSPDPYRRQLDGMGGGLSSLSKIVVVGPSTRSDADVDYTFAQIGIDDSVVDFGGNCGNMVSTVGPAALEMGYYDAGGQSSVSIRVHNTNTGKIIVSNFPVVDGLADYDGELAIDGVSSTASPIRLDFLEPGGSKTGKLLPTGSVVDEIALPDGRLISASLVDAANPCVFVEAASLGKTGTELPEQLAADATFMRDMEMIRQAGSVRMGLAKDLAAARGIPSIPKVAIVAAPRDYITLSGRKVSATEATLAVRMLSMEQPHRAIPITGAICLAVACRTPGTLPAKLTAAGGGAINLAHASGTILVDATMDLSVSPPLATAGTVYRTARKLFSGKVHYRAPA